MDEPPPPLIANVGQDRAADAKSSGRLQGRRPRRTLLAVSLAGVVVAVLLGFFGRDWIPSVWRSDSAVENPFPPGTLADYIPQDSEAVLFVNLRSLREAPIGPRYLMPSLRSIVRQSDDAFFWTALLGADALEDVDTLMVSFAPASDGQPLWLARGRFDRSRFQVGPDSLRGETIDRFRVWKCIDRQTNQPTLLAPVGDAFVVSDTPDRVLAALRQASDPRPVQVRDVTLRQQLSEVDRRANVWFAASLKGLGPVARIDNFWLEKILRPLLRYADSARGHIACAEELRAELHFHSASEENAAKLEEDLKNICGVAAGAPLLLSRHKALLPLFRLLASGETTREGPNVSLRCRLTAEQLSE
jgi:hypothetical protein